MRLLRLASAEPDADQLLKTALSDLRGLDDVVPSLEGAAPDAKEALEQITLSRRRAEALLRSGIASLETVGDILDDQIPQILWVCLHCGAVVANDLPNTCPVCGALGAEFEWFGPFYVETPERLGRMSPALILSTLEAMPAEIARLTSAVPDEALNRAPSAEQWCVKEIIGHMIETDRLFVKRIATLLERDDVPDLTAPRPPWRMHEGKGYEQLAIEELLQRFSEARALSLSMVRDLTPEQWSRRGALRDATTSLLDLGIWLANHDLGHSAQIRRLCGG
jgi:hypothetical protein